MILTLGTLLVLYGASVLHVGALSISWTTPVEGASYASGVDLFFCWNSTTVVKAPLFRLCIVKNEGVKTAEQALSRDSVFDTACGEATSAEVVREEGLEGIMLTTPDLSAASSFYLQMENSDGETSSSPVFMVSPSTVVSSTASAPTSAQSIPTSNVNEDPLILSRHNGVPAATWAVPVGVVITIVLVAGTLAFVQRRKLKRERKGVASLLDKSGGGSGSNSEVNSEKSALVNAILPWSPRRISDGSTVFSVNSDSLYQQTRMSAYEEPPRYAYGAIDYGYPPTHKRALARDILGSVPRVTPNLSWPLPTASIAIRPPVPHKLRPSTPLKASCAEGQGSASASIVDDYARSSLLPPTLPMPEFSQSGFQMPSVHRDRHREEAIPQTGKALTLQPGHDLYERVRQAIGS